MSKKSSGCFVITIILLVFVGSVVLLLFEPNELKEFALSLFPSSRPPAVSPSPVSPPSPTPLRSRLLVSPSPHPSPTPTVSPGEVKAALARAEELLRSGKGTEAVELLTGLCARPLPGYLSGKAREMLKSAREFAEMQAVCERAAEGGEGEPSLVKVKGGGTLEGKAVRREDGTVVVTTAGGVKITLRADEVERMEPLSPEVWRARHRKTLDNMLAAARRTGSKRWVDWWKAFRFARRYDFNPEQWLIYREMASRFGDVSARLYEYRATRLYRRALYFMSRGMDNSAAKAAMELLQNYPKASCAADAGELLVRLGRRSPVAQARNPGRSAPPSTRAAASAAGASQPERERVLAPPRGDSAELKRANSLYSRAKAFIGRAFDALENDDYSKAAKLFDRSVALLEEARDLYEQAAVSGRNREAVEAFIEQVNKLIYLCRKSKPVGVWK